MQSQQSDNKLTKQIRIDTWWHRFLKTKAAMSGISIKTLLEGHLAEIYKDETAGKEIES